MIRAVKICELHNVIPGYSLSWVRAGLSQGFPAWFSHGNILQFPSCPKHCHTQPLLTVLLFPPINCITKAPVQRSLFLVFPLLIFTTSILACRIWSHETKHLSVSECQTSSTGTKDCACSAWDGD